ncbi:tape measure protein [Lactiplantibacillus plantarum]|uniref:tape measure protein n=1 Tax=Lactiplantibacillus plantarum TaxID=1590 RepID=UPI0030B4C07B
MSRNIVSTQIIQWKFDDQVSQALQKVDSALKTLKQTLETVSGCMKTVESASKNVSEAVNDIGKNEKIKETADKVKDLGEQIKAVPKDHYTEFKENLNKTKSRFKDFITTLKSFPKDILYHVKDNLSVAGSRVKNFLIGLKQMPKEVLVHIRDNLTEAGNKVMRFGKGLKSLPKWSITTFKAVTEKAKVQVQTLWQKIKQIPHNFITHFKANNADETTNKIGKMGDTSVSTAKGIGIFSLALAGVKKALNLVSEAAGRHDTLQNYPKVIESMGASSKDAQRSVKTLSDGIKGLPTSLDGITKTAQAFFPMSKNADEAAKSALALNDAFIASGASAIDASRGMEQYKQMLSTGKVDLMSWKSLQETMPASLRKVAKSFGIVGDSAENDLYKKIQSGDITMRQLNARFRELDKGANGFAKTALKATGGWQTGMTNLHTAVVRNLANIMTAFDKLTVKVTGKSFLGWTIIASKSMESFSNRTVKAMGAVGTNFHRYFDPIASIVKPIVPLMTSLGKAFVIASIAVGSMSLGLKGLKMLLNISGLTSPWVLLATAIIAVGSALAGLYKHNPKFKKFVDNIGKSLQPIMEYFGRLKNSISALFTLASPMFSTLSKSVQKFVSGFSSSFSGFFNKKTFEKFKVPLDILTLDIDSSFSDIGQSIGDAFSGKKAQKMEKDANKLGKNVGKAFRGMVNSAAKIAPKIGQAFKLIASVIGQVIGGIVKSVYKSFTSKSGIGYAIIKTFQSILNTIMPIMRKISSGIGQAWRAIKKYFSNDGNSIMVVTKTIFNIIKATINVVMRSILAVIRGVMDVIKNVFSMVWGNIKEIVRGALKIIKGVFDVFAGIFTGDWRKVWEGVKSIFSGVWDAFQGIVKGVINGVLGFVNSMIDGFDVVWKFFTGHKSKIHHLKKLANGGTVGDTQTVMVNDSNRTHWKELIQLPNGRVGMAKQRNAVLALPKGTRVYSGEETHKLMNSMGIEHYKDGGIVGGFIDWSKGKLSDIGSWIGDKFEAMESFLTHPLKTVTGFIQKSVAGLTNHWPSTIVELSTGLMNKVVNIITSWMKPKVKKLDDDYGGSASGTYDPKMIERAARAMHAWPLPSGFMKLLQATIQNESGGKNVVQQIHDMNSGGNEAAGILQYTPGTFNAFAMPGHRNRMNPYDQLLAFFNNSDWRNSIGHTVIWGVPKVDWLHSGPQGHRRFALGGHVTQPTYAFVGENPQNDEYVINPYSSNARGLIQEASEKAGISDRNNTTAEMLNRILNVIKQNRPVYLNANGRLIDVTDEQLGNRMEDERRYRW